MPGQRCFGEQAFGDDARRCRRHANAVVTARARVFDALMLNHPHLLRHNVELLADVRADFHQRMAVMRADAFGFRQFMAHDLARQKRIERFATAFLAAVTGHLDRFGRAFLGDWRAVRRQRFGFVQKQIALSGIGPGFGFGGIQTMQKSIHAFLQ